MNIFIQLWCDNANYTQWQAIWISSIFLLINIGLCLAVWYLQKVTIVEVGYPRSKRKKVKKAFKAQPILDRILLRRLCKEATISNPVLNLCIVLNCINIAAVLGEVIGYIGAIITRGHGWALTLVLLSGFGSFCITAFIHSVSALLWVPSERKRWRP
jgi:hypothetical protein